MSQAPPPDDGRDSSPPQKPLASWYAQGLSDGVGDRLLMFDNSDAPSLELLRVRPELASAPGFEEALRERVQRLRGFRHPSFARVRAVENLEPDEGLAVVSNYTPGKRLSELLHQANGPRFAKALIRQLAPALALLQEQSAGPGHGTLNLDRIVVTPEGRLTIVEYVLGAAIDTLGLNSSQLASLGIAVPASDGETSAPLDAYTDIYQLGLIALSVLLGRPLGAGEHPQASRLLSQFAEAAERDGVSFSPLLQRWIERALQVDGETFQSLEEAQTALAELLQEDPRREPPRPGIAERSVATGSPPPVGPSAASQPEPVVNTQPFDRFTETIRPTAAPPRSPEQVFARGPEPPRKNDLNQPSSQARTLFDYEPTAGNRAPCAIESWTAPQNLARSNAPNRNERNRERPDELGRSALLWRRSPCSRRAKRSSLRGSCTVNGSCPRHRSSSRPRNPAPTWSSRDVRPPGRRSVSRLLRTCAGFASSTPRRQRKLPPRKPGRRRLAVSRCPLQSTCRSSKTTG